MRPHLKAAGSYGTVGLELVFSIVFGFLAGRWLDGRFGTEPTLTLIGFFFGLAAAIRSLWRAAARMKRETETDGFSDKHTNRDARFAMKNRRRGKTKKNK